jgi:hypothetical protein
MLSQNQTAPFTPEDYQSALNALVKELDKGVGAVFQRNRNVLEQQINVLVSQNDGLALAPMAKNPGDDIKSQDINGLMQAALFDIQAIYSRIRRSRDMRNARESVQKASLAEPERTYSELKDKVKGLEYLLKYSGNDRVSFVSFRDFANYFKGASSATVERDIPKLMLQQDSSLNLAANASVTFSAISGGTVTEDSGHGTDKIVDRDPRSYWAATFFSPDPLPAIDVPLGSGRTYVETAGSAVGGAVGSLVIELPQVSQFNCVKIKPFSKFPIRIIDISSSIDLDSEFDQVPSFNSALATPNNDYIIFQFGLVEARRLRITIAQENSEQVHHEIDAQRVNNSTLADLIDPDSMSYTRGSSDEPELVSRAVNTLRAAILSTAGMPGDQQLNAVIAAAGQIVSGLDYNTGAEILKRTTVPPESSIIGLHGYVYSIGVSDIQILRNVYAKGGYYASEKFPNANDIVRIQIVTDESHPVLYDSKGLPHVQTATSWAIGIGSGRSIPILPLNFSDNQGLPFVPCEELLFKTSKTRWPIDTSKWMEVRANGLVLTDYEVKSSGGSSIVGLGSYNPNIAYTVAYYPLVDATNPDPRDLLIEEYMSSIPFTDEYPSTDDKGVLQLVNFPFVSRDIVNDLAHFTRPDPTQGKWYYSGAPGYVLAYMLSDPMKTPLNVQYTAVKAGGVYGYYIIDGRKWGNLSASDQAEVEGGIYFEYEPLGVQIGSDIMKNVTDYAASAQAAPASDLEFVQDGDKLVFNRQITAPITVNSDAMVESIELTCRLACCRTSTRDVTPMVKEVSILTAGRR